MIHYHADYTLKSCEISASHTGADDLVFSDTSPCRLVQRYQCFRGACCFHRQGIRIGNYMPVYTAPYPRTLKHSNERLLRPSFPQMAQSQNNLSRTVSQNVVDSNQYAQQLRSDYRFTKPQRNSSLRGKLQHSQIYVILIPLASLPVRFQMPRT